MTEARVYVKAPIDLDGIDGLLVRARGRYSSLAEAHRAAMWLGETAPVVLFTPRNILQIAMLGGDAPASQLMPRFLAVSGAPDGRSGPVVDVAPCMIGMEKSARRPDVLGEWDCAVSAVRRVAATDAGVDLNAVSVKVYELVRLGFRDPETVCDAVRAGIDGLAARQAAKASGGDMDAALRGMVSVMRWIRDGVTFWMRWPDGLAWKDARKAHQANFGFTGMRLDVGVHRALEALGVGSLGVWVAGDGETFVVEGGGLERPVVYRYRSAEEAVEYARRSGAGACDGGDRLLLTP